MVAPAEARAQTPETAIADAVPTAGFLPPEPAPRGARVAHAEAAQDLHRLGLAQVVDEAGLYGLPLEEFVPARDALAKELRASGDKDAAKRVKSLRRPTVVMWTANQLARKHPDVITELLDAASSARALQERALRGEPVADEVRHASRKRQELINRLAREAGANRDAVSRVLLAASADPDLADALRSGTLTREPEPAGFGEIPEDAVLAAPADKPKPPREPSRKDLDELADEAEGRAVRLEREARAAQEKAGAAQQKVDAAQAAADAAREGAEEASRRAEEARREADEARIAARGA